MVGSPVGDGDDVVYFEVVDLEVCSTTRTVARLQAVEGRLVRARRGERSEVGAPRRLGPVGDVAE